jgi:purine-cytosine permease-like protein
MPFKILAGVVAMVLVIGYLLPPIFKLKDVALGAVICIGITLILIDLVQSLQSKED